METKNVDIEFILANGRIIPGNINKYNIIENLEILKQDRLNMIGLLQDIITATDVNRQKIQEFAISKGSAYLANMGIPLVDYYHMNDGDYRLSTTLIMDTIIVINTLLDNIQDEKID